MAASDWIAIASIVVSGFVALVSTAVGYLMFQLERRERRQRPQSSNNNPAAANQSIDSMRQEVAEFLGYLLTAIATLLRLAGSVVVPRRAQQTGSPAPSTSAGVQGEVAAARPPDEEEPGAPGLTREPEVVGVDRHNPQPVAPEPHDPDMEHDVPDSAITEAPGPGETTVGPQPLSDEKTVLDGASRGSEPPGPAEAEDTSDLVNELGPKPDQGLGERPPRRPDIDL